MSVIKFGKNHKISCRSDTEPMWYRNDVPLRPTHKIKGWLNVTRVDRVKRGIYTCRGTTKRGETFYARSTVKVLSEL